MSEKVKKALPQAQAQVIYSLFKQAFNLTTAMYHACNTNDKCLPCSELVELLYPLAEQLEELDVICVSTHWSVMANVLRRYSDVLMEVLEGNQKKITASYFAELLGPLLSDLNLVIQEYTETASTRKAANGKSVDTNRNDDEGVLPKPLPIQEPPIRDGLQITTPPENILELIKASLAGKPDDIWAQYQACLTADLTPEEVKTANDSLIVMLEEHFI